MSKDIEIAVKYMKKIANDDTHGYDQAHRYGPDYDCSSLVTAALRKAGFNIAKTSYTGNLKEQLIKEGFVPCKKPWMAGDIHLAIGHHVAMSINANQIAHASINEKGKTTGGKTGDQTGKEICIRSYYEYPWDIHLRYPHAAPVADKKSIKEVALEVIDGKYGTAPERKKNLEKAGYDYAAVQEKVNKILNKSK